MACLFSRGGVAVPPPGVPAPRARCSSGTRVMATDTPARRPTARLRGRSDEMSMLAGLVTAVRAGESRVLVVRGEAGVGKTALLDDLAEQARGCRVVRTAGMQSEIDLAFAGLHQLLSPM